MKEVLYKILSILFSLVELSWLYIKGFLAEPTKVLNTTLDNFLNVLDNKLRDKRIDSK